MSLKSLIVPRLAQRLLGEGQLNAKRAKFERSRRRNAKPHIVEFFHDPTDPYSQLLATIILQLSDKYTAEILTHLVSPPDDNAAPEREKLAKYSQKDANLLAKKAGLEFTFQSLPPAQNTGLGDARRDTLGHYLGGMLYYGGEWYWGLDRLHYLESRLSQLGLRKDPSNSPIYAQPSVPSGSGDSGAVIHWYLSFRSPYTAIIPSRIKALADAYNAELKLRFVLPMVMRGLPISPKKKAYIPLDTAREARRLGVPFGRICDPVGEPIERGYSLLPWAREQGREFEFTQSWFSAVFAKGVNAGSNGGMKKIVERAGLSWAEASKIIGNENWRAEAEKNRVEMMEHGIWGVPSFRVGKTITWGQDRLWVIEDALRDNI